MVSAKYDALAGGREKYLGESELVEDMVRWMVCGGKGKGELGENERFLLLICLGRGGGACDWGVTSRGGSRFLILGASIDDGMPSQRQITFFRVG